MLLGEREVSYAEAGWEVPGVGLRASRRDGVHVLAVAGVGFGLMSGAFSMINLLADALGPGTVGIHGDSQLYFLTSGECVTSALCSHLCHSTEAADLWAGVAPPCCTLHPAEPLTVLCHISTLLNPPFCPL